MYCLYTEHSLTLPTKALCESICVSLRQMAFALSLALYTSGEHKPFIFQFACFLANSNYCTHF